MVEKTPDEIIKNIAQKWNTSKINLDEAIKLGIKEGIQIGEKKAFLGNSKLYKQGIKDGRDEMIEKIDSILTRVLHLNDKLIIMNKLKELQKVVVDSGQHTSNSKEFSEKP